VIRDDRQRGRRIVQPIHSAHAAVVGVPERRQAAGALAQGEFERWNRRELAAKTQHFDRIGTIAVQAAPLAQGVLEHDRNRRRNTGGQRRIHGGDPLAASHCANRAVRAKNGVRH
jgi:hypothetical protein